MTPIIEKNIIAEAGSLLYPNRNDDKLSVKHGSGGNQVVPSKMDLSTRRSSLPMPYLSLVNVMGGTTQLPLQEFSSTAYVQHVDDAATESRSLGSEIDELGAPLTPQQRRAKMRERVFKRYRDEGRLFAYSRAWLAVRRVPTSPPDRSLSSTFASPVERLAPSELRQTRCKEIVDEINICLAKISSLKNRIASNERSGIKTVAEAKALDAVFGQLIRFFGERDIKANEIIREESSTQIELDFLNKLINQISESEESEPEEIDLLSKAYVYLMGKIKVLNAANSTSTEGLVKTGDELLLNLIIQNRQDRAIEILELNSKGSELTPGQFRLLEMISKEIADDTGLPRKSENFDDTASERRDSTSSVASVFAAHSEVTSRNNDNFYSMPNVPLTDRTRNTSPVIPGDPGHFKELVIWPPEEARSDRLLANMPNTQNLPLEPSPGKVEDGASDSSSIISGYSDILKGYEPWKGD